MESESIVDMCHQFKPRNILWSLIKAMIFAYFNYGSKRQHPAKNYKIFNYVLLAGWVTGRTFGAMVNLHSRPQNFSISTFFNLHLFSTWIVL